MAQPLSFRWDEDFIARIDAARKTPLGQVSRSAFVRDAVELAIRRAEQAQALAAETPEDFARRKTYGRLARSVAGPNVENVRSSQQAKRNVSPIPKGARRGS